MKKTIVIILFAMFSLNSYSQKTQPGSTKKDTTITVADALKKDSTIYYFRLADINQFFSETQAQIYSEGWKNVTLMGILSAFMEWLTSHKLYQK